MGDERPTDGARVDAPGDRTRATATGFIGLPVGSRQPRWWLPRGSRRVVQRSLDVYHPVSRRSLLGWQLARFVAGTGLLAVLPAPPAPPVLEEIRSLIPRGAVVAIAVSWRPGRAHALVMDQRGHASAFIKILGAPDDRDRVADEGNLADRLGPHLTAPLSSPRLLARGDRYLMFEPVRWIPTWRAADLPLDVAAAMGRFYRAGASEPGGPGFGHGDFVPWNLMRTDTGWSLVDWGDARVDAPAYSDVFHFVLRSSALLGHPSADAIVEGAYGRGPLAPVFAAFAEGAGIPPSSAPRYLDVFLRDYREWVDEDPDGDPSRKLRDRLLRTLENIAP